MEVLSTMEVNNIIESLRKRELGVLDVPKEFALDNNVIKVERELGLRKSGHKGFDVITQKFFVEETLFDNDNSRDNKMTFNSFEEYYKFLDGDIYEDACYYQYVFDDKVSKNFNLDMDRLYKTKSFITETIDDYLFELSKDDIEGWKHCEIVNKKCVKQWMNKFNMCNTYEELKRLCSEFENSIEIKYKGLDFFLFQYAFNDKNNKHLDILMKFLSEDYDYSGYIVLGLCLIYPYSVIFEKYNFSQSSVVTNKRRKKRVKDFGEELKNSNVDKRIRGYFDKVTHFYCEETKVYRYKNYQGRKVLGFVSINFCKAFETFDEFIKYRKGNLKNCDLSEAIDLDVDFSKYIIDDTTKLPINKEKNLTYKVIKRYENNEFLVYQFWVNEDKEIIKKYIHRFLYFFDFVSFLKGDLSGADLLFCKGMLNLLNLDGLNISEVEMKSEVCDKFNIDYEKYDYSNKFISEFSKIEENEEETNLVYSNIVYNHVLPLCDNGLGSKGVSYITYISDLHLMHRIKNAGCKSKLDVVYTIKNIVDGILDENAQLTLIGGDVSSDFSIFVLFVEMLRYYSKEVYWKRDFIFVLGNHELWGFPELSLDEIVDKYRTVLEENGMYLLHNDLFYRNEENEIGIIPYAELIQLDNQVILDKLKCTRLLVLGGMGFSGYNKEFNADNGVYRETINRNIEVQESKKFEELYNKLIDVLEKKHTIILTHMPKEDWCKYTDYHEDFVYVSGHTHKNVFFNDGLKRIYADNQIGYRNESIHLKHFNMDNEYEYFSDYKDGIYEITAKEYQDFYRGKNIQMNFNRKVNILYMLKKKGYYCFIHKTKTGALCILNGGAMKKLDKTDVNYYYDNMDYMIAYIETPLDKYTEYQESIACEIIKIGGSGHIHGSIIDIDYYNHLYVNPIDMKITSYWASDIVNKHVYPTLSALLKDKCPKLYNKYLKLIKGKKSNPLVVNQVKSDVDLLPQEYLDTSIYKASNEIKKMQKLQSNLLTTWYDIVPKSNELACKNK